MSPLILRYRAAKGKEDAVRRGERYGKPSIPRPDGALLWLHAASMGESQSILPFIALLQQQHQHVRIVLTTTTVTSARFMAARLPDNALHQFVPLDVPWMIKRFLRHWQPNMVAFVDSEIWPVTMRAIAKRNVPFILLNGRLSPASFQRWQKLPAFAAMLMQQFSMIYAKSDNDAEAFRQLGAPRVMTFGNMKFSAKPLPADPKTTGALIQSIAGRPVWLAASTHDGEEALIADIHMALREQYADLLTIIVPRHATRGDAICAMLREHQLPLAQRSKDEAITPTTEIYIADTMGELGLFYRIASIVFIGGSLVPHGGQNPLEAARLDCAVLYGPHMFNFTEFCQVLEAQRAAITVADEDALQKRLEQLLRDQDYQQTCAQAALDVANDNAYVVERIYKDMQPMLDALLVKHNKDAS